MSRFPDPAASRAVLIGFDRYDDERALPRIPAVRTNLADLGSALVEAPTGTLYARHRKEVSGRSATVADLGRAVTTAAAEATDLLLVYYAGHGLVDARGRLHLAVPSTDPASLGWTALPFEKLREEIADSPAAARVLVLDCCFSGRAIEVMADDDGVITGQIDIAGTYTVTSTTGSALSHAPAGAKHTAFTGALLSELNTDAAPLTLDELFRRTDRRLAAQGLPRPQRRVVNAAGDLALFKTSGTAPEAPPRAPTPVTRTEDRRPRRMPWQAKGMLAIWALLGVLAVLGTMRALSDPKMLGVGATFSAAFQLKDNAAGGKDVTPIADLAIVTAAFAWLPLPFFTARVVYVVFPVSAGPTARALSCLGTFIAGGWAAFFASLAVEGLLARWMSLAAAVVVTLIGVAVVVVVAIGWANEANLLPVSARARRGG